MLSSRSNRRLTSGASVRGLLGSSRRSPAGSATGAPPRRNSTAQFDLDMEALRLKNDFPLSDIDPTICFVTGAAFALSCRETTDPIPHNPRHSDRFPTEYDPPLPSFWSSLNMTNLVIVFLNGLRDAREAGVLPSLSEEMRKKELLAEYYISLVCIDNLVTWRDIPRPSSYLGAAPVQPDRPWTQDIERRFIVANPTRKTRSVHASQIAALESSSDPPQAEEFVLWLNQGSDAVHGTVNASTGVPQGSPALPEVSGAGIIASLSLRDDDDSSLPALSDTADDDSDASKGPTSPDDSLQEEEISKVRVCGACKEQESRREKLESKVEEARREARDIFHKQVEHFSRAEPFGIRRALEELFFRQEGVETYGDIRATLRKLADDMEQLKSEKRDDALHTCQREAVMEGHDVVRVEERLRAS